MKKHFNKELVMIKKDNEDFKNSTKCWVFDHDYAEGRVKVRGHCNITGKYRSSALRVCYINVKLNHKIPSVFHNLKRYDSHLIMQELGKFSFKIYFILNGLEKHIVLILFKIGGLKRTPPSPYQLFHCNNRVTKLWSCEQIHNII